MKSLARLTLIALAGSSAVAAQEPPSGDGPRGSSQVAAGEVRYDAVGYAVVTDVPGISAVSTALAAGSYAEVTALDSGRTIVVAIVGGDVATGRVAAVSSGAAAALGGTGGDLAIRIRRVTPTPQDVVQLRQGAAASFRADAPAALLTALRKNLPATTPSIAVPPTGKPIAPPMTRAPAARPSTKPVMPAPVKPATSGYIVQVAALSSEARARKVAAATGGSIIAGPPVWRVRLGPYPDIAAATRARDTAARKGYPAGQITRIP